jgi:23S rRNA pseudouridine1911/1915/1917 synthase
MKYDLTCEVGQDETGMTVKGVLRRHKGISLRLIRRIVHGEGDVLLNGNSARFIDRVTAGDVIGLIFPSEKQDLHPQDIPITVLYEDDDLLIVDKQPGIVVHPTKGHPAGTVANGVARYMHTRDERYKVRLINRLDMDTSGVLLIGKNGHAQSDFTARAGRSQVEKKYLAIVSGSVMPESGVIDLPIGLEAEGAVRRTVRADGYPSITHYCVKERFGDGFALLELRLGTGRTHQIRVHLAHIGCPILGDVLYGTEIDASALIDRQALHAFSLRFPHPSTGKEVYVEAPLPADMKHCLEILRDR